MTQTLALSTLCENPRHPTGLSTFFPAFVRHARAAYPQVEWVVFAGRDTPWQSSDPGVRVCRKFPSNEHPLARLAADHLRVPSEARRLGARALVSVGFHPARDAGLPVVMQVFAVPPASGGGLRERYRRWAVARGLKRSALVIANSGWTASQLARPSGPMLVSPEGLDREKFTPEGPRGFPGLAGPYFLWASNFYPYKRAELVIQAYGRLPLELRTRIPLVMAGGDWAGERGRLQARVEALGLAHQVRFLGWVEDAALPGLFRGALMHLLSSSEETFGRSVLEAMACGCPSLVQALPVFREVAGPAALYVDYTDANAAAQVLESIARMPERLASLRALALARAAEFSYERLARERVGAILPLLGGLQS